MTDTLETKSRQYVTFRLSKELFGAEVTRTKEILSLTPVTQVPQTPDYMLGVINLRGQVVPVVDMRLKLGLPAEGQTEDTCIIVVEVLLDDETLIVGALADAVCEVLEVAVDQIEPPPKLGTRLNTDYISGMAKVNDQFTILLNIDRIFKADDLSLVQQLSGDESSVESEKELAEA